MIRDGESLVKSGDKIAIELYKKYNNIQHSNYNHLHDTEVKAIIDYLKTFN